MSNDLIVGLHEALREHDVNGRPPYNGTGTKDVFRDITAHTQKSTFTPTSFHIEGDWSKDIVILEGEADNYELRRCSRDKEWWETHANFMVEDEYLPLIVEVGGTDYLATVYGIIVNSTMHGAEAKVTVVESERI